MDEKEIKDPEGTMAIPEKNDNRENKDNICGCQPLMSHHKLVLSAVALIFLSAFFGAIFGFMGGSLAGDAKLDIKKFFTSSFKKETDGKGKDSAKNTVIEEESATIEVVEKSFPAVVSIVITKDVPTYRSMFNDPFGFFSPFDSGGNDPGSAGTERKKVGGGSGFIATNDGLIVTNRHVVSDMDADYTVMASDGKEYPAQVLARDPVRDIAIIKIEGSDFPVLPMGDSDNLKIGQTVIAIGNSLGEFSNSVSKGIISGLKREVTAGSGYGEEERLTGIIQTDAAINPGNSGGPLLNINGDVIGVNVAMAQGAENIGFALPIKQVEKIVDQVKTQGKISTPYLGVRYVIINEEIKKNNNLAYEYGALVLRGERISDLAVVPGSPADKAGIVENDIILEINGKKITDKEPLADIISELNVGDTVTATVWHKGEVKDYRITLEERK